MDIEIQSIVSGKIGFASHQNAAPLLRELSIVNQSSIPISDLVLELVADPPFLTNKIWRLDRIDPDTTLRIPDRNVQLNATYLGALTESVRGTVTLRLVKDGADIATSHAPVEVLARSEWGGTASMAELLPAFVMPNDPAVDKVLKAASETLRRAGKPSGLDGYEAKSRQRSWTLISALWSAVAGLRLSYALPPASFEQSGQKIRSPGAILEGRVATCLDTATLFAAAMEQMGLNPLIVMIKGHAFAGAWLQSREFADIATDEAAALRKRLDLEEIVVFETTFATQVPTPSFSQAVQEARRLLVPENDEGFYAVIDIRRGRMRQIKPLDNLRGPQEVSEATQQEDVPPGLEEPPPLPDESGDAIAAKPDAVLDRITLWQRKLLDLTARNRLLNLPAGSSCVPILCHDPAKLEDRLAAGHSIRIVPMPDLASGGRDSEIYDQQRRTNLREDVAREALGKDEIISDVDPKNHESALVELYRKSRSDINEGGANTLFLALGFLRWKKTDSDQRVNRAPLILLPVRLERRSARSGFTLKAHEDEARFNLTLVELLRQDFELNVDALAGPLPTDNDGIDILRVWNMVRSAVRDSKGFEVSTDIVLGTFSFSKYLMWKDLVDRSASLRDSPIVRHLLDRKSETYSNARQHIPPEALDDKVDPSKLFLPLPADSSQIAAAVASADGMDFVLDGPPGTGKSQTIANIIAHNLALGRRILFVAEKMAALEVVHRRLADKKLSNFCLELHSNKATKTAVLEQLDAAWNVAESLSHDEWTREASELARLRDGLNSLVRSLHKRAPNGLTLHEAIGLVVRDGSDVLPKLTWPDSVEHDAQDMARMRDAVRRLQMNSQPVSGLMDRLSHLTHIEWSNAWQEQVAAAAQGFLSEERHFNEACAEIVAATGINFQFSTLLQTKQALALVDSIVGSHGLDLRFAFAPNLTAKAEAAGRALRALEVYKDTEKKLSTTYVPESARRIEWRSLIGLWHEAKAKIWPLSHFSKKKIAATLQAHGGTTTPPDPERDLPIIEVLAGSLSELDAVSADLSGMPGWAQLNSDSNQLRKAVELGLKLRQTISEFAGNPDELADIRQKVSRLVIDANDVLGEGGKIQRSLTTLKLSLSRLSAAASSLMTLSSGSPLDQIRSISTLASSIVESRAQLNAWCSWMRASNEAMSFGLSPIVDLAKAGLSAGSDLSQLFEIVYARWFAARTIDADPIIRNFVAAEHLAKIEDFRKLDDKLSDLSVRYIKTVLTKGIPRKDDALQDGGYAVLRHQLQLQRRHKPIRQLITDMGPAFTHLAPCMLMSPLSVAQYLPPDKTLFDLIIFDEASQIAPWDAIGVIARGKQLIVAGDHRQMPPTNFFSRGASSVDDDIDEDMESILDECKAAGLPQIGLTWHYRSQHESLIAFSNDRYYEGSLVTFPAPITKKSAVTWRKIDGVYSKGKSQTNSVEAQAMVDEVVRRLRDGAKSGAADSIAVVTLNSQQQALVEDLLDKARRGYPEIEPFFDEDITEPVVVKNLETVQGDERDVVLLGIGFGPTTQGSDTMSMHFGPLNREGGWRRLNVAITRAKKEMVVFTSFSPGMIDLHRTSARAVADLKHFIEFAERGPRALATSTRGSVGGYESPFEAAVAAELGTLGWRVIPQIGVSRFRIDLGVVHPDRLGDYLVGVECDGAMYHSGATARDRDKIRAAILEKLGWKLVRIWSTDWWIDKKGALARTHEAINQILSESREREASVANVVAAADAATAVYANIEVLPDNRVPEAPAVQVTEAEPVRELFARGASASATKGVVGTFRPANAQDSQLILDRNKFEDPDYVPTLVKLIAFVLECEAPMRDDVLVERVARAHGFQRSGDRIRDRVIKIARRSHFICKDPVGGRFAWLNEPQWAAWSIARKPFDDSSVRLIEDIASEEIRMAQQLCAGGDAPIEIARYFGIRRLSAAARDRIENALKA